MHVPSWEGVREKRQLLVPTSYIDQDHSQQGIQKKYIQVRWPVLRLQCLSVCEVSVLFVLLVFVVKSDYTSNTCLWRGRHVEVKS